MTKQSHYIGAHLSIAGGVETVFDRAREVGADCVQIFTKSNKSYFAPDLSASRIAAFKKARAESEVKVVVTHAAYLINLAASDEEIARKSMQSLAKELERCNQLGIEYLVLHPGSHGGNGVEEGIARIAKNLDAIFDAVGGSCMILLETAAGQGASIGATFAELRAIYDASAHKKRLGICLDTCHVHSAGYSLVDVPSYEKVMEQFFSVIPASLLKCIHLNDSKTEVASRKDRHANLGTGSIPLSVFKRMVTDQRLAGIPLILETPSADGIIEYRNEIKLLREF